MKKYTPLLLLVLLTTFGFAQKKDKIKGSKKVITELKTIGTFSSIEINDNLEISLEKGETPSIKIEADDNLHDVISLDLRDGVLRLFTSKEIIKYKKLTLKVTYTNDLTTIIAKDQSIVNAIQEIQSNGVTIRSFGSSKLFLNVNVKDFELQSEDKSKIELNLKSESAKIILSNDAALKSLISTVDLTSDLYQDASANIEGNATKATIRLDNDSKFTGKKLTIKNLDLITEIKAECSVNAENNISIAASGKSEIELYGSPKIDMRKFTDEVKLLKK
ncbi:DUF2807 domain-containing protein [Flavobacterium sp. K5-23]|uniref:GIN domain-containing protein n=1 Tax=Flavobacterium sp. K5-23 TaxID=2746225 RepID=UPI0020104E12|nr:DUF2807 domain-containing protein [Flavobacterium sp. K5-23]UQD56255.1 DUF2807 domain-containing protein [Flavobacterium sp. K5-23]